MLKKLSLVGNESGSSQLITAQMMTTAIVTQNGWAARHLASSAAHGVAFRRPLRPTVSRSLVSCRAMGRAMLSSRPDGAGDEAGDLLGRAVLDGLVGDL